MTMRAACLGALLAALVACGGSDDAGPDSTDTASGEFTTPAQLTTTQPSPAPTAEEDLIQTTLPATTEEASIAEELDLAPIELLTAPAGGGTRPLLEWTEVDGAVNYHVVVLAPNDSTYWAWRTDSTSVPVGGLPQLEPDAAGPSISPGMSWSVMAVDADGAPIALSGRRPIDP